MNTKFITLCLFLLSGAIYLALHYTDKNNQSYPTLLEGKGKSQKESANGYSFTIHHFLNTQSLTHKDFLQPWSDKLTSLSGGKMKFKIYPNMTLGGSPKELYYQVRDGVVDIAWTLIGYTPGLFPLTEVFELPTVHWGDAVKTTLALQKTFPLLRDDFKAIKVLLLHTHSGNSFHFEKYFNKKISAFEDFKLLKIRTPSRTGSWLLEILGSQGIGMPVPDIPQALSKKIIQGTLLPFEIAKTLKIPELTSISIKGENDRRFGTSVFLLAMNLEKFNSLPDSFKKILEDNSNINIAKEVSLLWEKAERAGEQAQLDSGGEIIELKENFFTVFDKKNKELDKRWLEDVKIKKNYDARELLKVAKENVREAKY